jgi:acyl-CoA thioesterase I
MFPWPQLRAIALAIGAVTQASPAVAIADEVPTTIVALGASQTNGKGVARSEAYPAQLEMLLRAAGYNVHVLNEGISGETTCSMLGRLGSAVPGGTRAVILQPGGNDKRTASGDCSGEIESRLKGRGIAVIMLPNSYFQGMPRSDGQHLTPEGYHAIAVRLLPEVEAAIGR